MRFQRTRKILPTAFGDVAVYHATDKGCLIIPFMCICVIKMERSGVMGYTYFPKWVSTVFRYEISAGPVLLLYDL